MKGFTKILTGIVSLSVLLLSNARPADQPDKTIKILTQKSDALNVKDWDKYITEVKNFLTTTTAENALIRGYDFDFKINEDKGYEENTKLLVKQLKEGTYDMFIVDDNFLFGDVAFIESDYVNSKFDREIHENYVDLTSKVKPEDISYHDAKILEGGRIDQKLYALPYEKDYDLLYYHTSDATASNLDLEKSTWDALLSIKAGSQTACGINYANEDELLNTFMEYTYALKDLPIPYDKIMYNDAAKDIYNSFKTFVTSNTLPSTDVDSSTLEKVYEAFQKNQVAFFKGKASHYKNLIQDVESKDVSVKLPPKNYSSIKKKYLVVNKNSKFDENVLVEAAIKLTSKDFQLFKAETCGKLPTFDISKADDSIKTYIEKHKDIVDLEGKIKPLNNREIFTGGNSAPLLEIRVLLPQDIKNYLKEGKDKDLTNVFENTKEVLMDKANVVHLPTILLYTPIIIFSIIAIVVIVLIFKYKNHPYMKIASPGYCILCIIGITMNILSPLIKMEITSISVCKFIYIYETVYTDLMIFPLVAITYRIYTIYKNKAKDNKSKNLNQKVSFGFIIALIIMIIYSTITSLCFNEFHFMSYGTIDTYRQPVCENVRYRIFEFIERRVNEFIYLVMIYLIIRTGRISKKFGEFKFIYFLFVIGIMEYTLSFLLSKLPSNGYYGFYLICIIISAILNTFLIYYLVGSRLIYVIKHPNESESYKIEELVNNNNQSTINAQSHYEIEE